MRFLLVGGEGFIGKRVAKVLMGMGHGVWTLDACISQQDTYGLSPPPMEFETSFRGDVRNPQVVNDVVGMLQPDCVVQLACIPVEGWCDIHPREGCELILNTTLNTLCACSGRTIRPRFVYISSSMVYGDFPPGGAEEDSPKRPKSAYGAAKLAGEELVRGMCRRFGLRNVIVRPCAVYGPGDRNGRVVQKLLETAIDGNPLVLKGPETMIDFTWIDDSAFGIALACLYDDADETFNIARGRARSLQELGQIVQHCIPTANIHSEQAPRFRPERGTMVIERARARLGFEPEVDLEEGVVRYYQWMMSQRRGGND